jgi:hypothetical protein
MNNGLANDTLKQARVLRREFIFGFGQTAGISHFPAAESLWNNYSQFLTADQRRLFESGGRQEGFQQGTSFRGLFEAWRDDEG